MLEHRLMKSPTRFSLLLLALLPSSCSYPGLKRPLSDPDKAKADTRLIGAWRAVEEQSKKRYPDILFIGKSGHRGAPPGIMKFVMSGIDAEDVVITDKGMYFFTSSVGKNDYINCFEGVVLDRSKFLTWDKKNIEMYVIAKYKVEEDKLTIWLMDKDAVEAAIQKKQVEGTIVKGKNQKVITLTGGENLSKFMAGGGDKVLFPEKDAIAFTRVK